MTKKPKDAKYVKDLEDFNQELLECIENLSGSLAQWVEIGDPEDARDYDLDALDEADRLLAKAKTNLFRRT